MSARGGFGGVEALREKHGAGEEARAVGRSAEVPGVGQAHLGGELIVVASRKLLVVPPRQAASRAKRERLRRSIAHPSATPDTETRRSTAARVAEFEVVGALAQAASLADEARVIHATETCFVDSEKLAGANGDAALKQVLGGEGADEV